MFSSPQGDERHVQETMQYSHLKHVATWNIQYAYFLFVLWKYPSQWMCHDMAWFTASVFTSFDCGGEHIGNTYSNAACHFQLKVGLLTCFVYNSFPRSWLFSIISSPKFM